MANVSALMTAFSFSLLALRSSTTAVWELPKLTKIEANTPKESAIKYTPNLTGVA